MCNHIIYYYYAKSNILKEKQQLPYFMTDNARVIYTKKV